MAKVEGIPSTRVPKTPSVSDATPVISRRETKDSTPVKVATDGVESQRPTAPDSEIAALRAEVAALRQQHEESKKVLDEERAARVEREQKEAEEAKKPGFFRTVMEIFDLFNRFFNPLWNLACALFRILRIGYDLLTGKEVDWKKEGTKLVAELGGAALQIFLPGVGGIIGGALSAGVEGYMNWKHNESEILGGGYNAIKDHNRQVDYGIRRTAENAYEAVKDIYGGAKKLITGKDDNAADDGVKPLKPAEVSI